MQKAAYTGFLALSFWLTVSSPAFAAEQSDYRELNRAGIAALRGGNYSQAETLFKEALAKYLPEPTQFDASIKNNLGILYEKMGRSIPSELAGNVSTSPPPQGSSAATSINFNKPSIQQIAQQFFDQEATKRMRTPTRVPMGMAKISKRLDGSVQVSVSVPQGANTLEIEASFLPTPADSFQLMKISSDLIRPVYTASFSTRRPNQFGGDEEEYGGKKPPPPPPARPPLFGGEENAAQFPVTMNPPSLPSFAEPEAAPEAAPTECPPGYTPAPSGGA